LRCQIWTRLLVNRQLDVLVPNEDQLERVRRLLLKHYQLLYEVFMSSCTAMSGELSFQDFAALVRQLDFQRFSSNRDLLERIFLESTWGDILLTPGLVKPHSDMDFGAFFLALLSLAITHYIDVVLWSRMPTLSLLELRRRRTVLSALSPEGLPTVDKALDSCIKEFLGPWAHQRSIDAMIKHTASSTEVLAQLADWHNQLQKVGGWAADMLSSLLRSPYGASGSRVKIL
jgi:hypothetical protein